MRVEAVDHENPFGIRIGVHGAANVCDELWFGARRLQRRANDLPRYHVQTGSQRRRPVPRVFKFLLGHAVGLGWFVGSVPSPNVFTPEGLDGGRVDPSTVKLLWSSTIVRQDGTVSEA